MRHSIHVAAGAIVFAALAFLAGSIVTQWFADRLARSNDDIHRSVAIFLLIWPLAMVAGAYVGHRVCKRRQ